MSNQHRNIITTFTGRETHNRGSSNIGVHVLTGRSVEPLATLARDKVAPGLEFMGTGAQTVSSVTGLDGSLVGSWQTRQVSMPDGLPILVRWQRNIASQTTTGLVDKQNGVSLFMCRRGYPFLQVEYPTIEQDKQSRRWVGFTGRCREISLNELRAKDIAVPKAVQVMLEDPAMVRPVVTTLEPGYIAIPEIVQRDIVADGEVKRITTSRRRRKLEI